MKMFSLVNRVWEFGFVYYRRVKITEKRLVRFKRLGFVNYGF